MDKILDWFYGIIVRPVDTLGEIIREKPVGWAFLIYLATSFFGFVLSNPDLQELGVPAAFTIVMGTFLSIISIFVITAFLHLFSRLFQGEGYYWNLFSALGFAQFPAIFVPPVHLLGTFLGRPGGTLSGIISIGISIWILVLNVIALRESHKISTGASVVTYLLTLVALFILMAVPFIIVIVFLWALF